MSPKTSIKRVCVCSNVNRFLTFGAYALLTAEGGKNVNFFSLFVPFQRTTFQATLYPRVREKVLHLAYVKLGTSDL